jgi:hypothetical protein
MSLHVSSIGPRSYQAKAFAGTIETQERDTLHQHVTLYISNMVVNWMREWLQDEIARMALFEYLVPCCL